jgi:hypothetical protein
MTNPRFAASIGAYTCPNRGFSRWHGKEENSKIWWRRRESNPRPKSMSEKRLHAQSVPKVSQHALRMDKMRVTLVRGSHRRGSDRTAETSLLCDVPPKPTGKAAEDGYLIN